MLKKSSWNDFQSFAILTRSRTKRLQKALCELGLKIGGQAGADVGSELGISGSRDTILRLVRQSHPSAHSEPHVIGLDDWARKRRLRYGTLICDLELGLPVDLLPDRAARNGLRLAAQTSLHQCGQPRWFLRICVSYSKRSSSSCARVSDRMKPLNPLLTLSAQQAIWLFFRKLEDLKEEERENLRQLRQMSSYLETAYQLVEMFLHMVRERAGEQLDAWRASVKASHLEAFESFVTGVRTATKMPFLRD